MVSKELQDAFIRMVGPNNNCPHLRLRHGINVARIGCDDCGSSFTEMDLVEEVRLHKAARASLPGRMWDYRHRFGKNGYCEYCAALLGTSMGSLPCPQNSPAMANQKPFQTGVGTLQSYYDEKPDQLQSGVVQSMKLRDIKDDEQFQRFVHGKFLPQKQVDCTCPTLLNGHHNGCPMRR